MTPTPGRLACLSLQKVHCSMFMSAEATPQLGRCCGEPMFCSDCPPEAAGQNATAPYNMCSRGDTNLT